MRTAADTQVNKVSEDFLITKNKKYFKKIFQDGSLLDIKLSLCGVFCSLKSPQMFYFF